MGIDGFEALLNLLSFNLTAGSFDCHEEIYSFMKKEKGPPRESQL